MGGRKVVCKKKHDQLTWAPFGISQQMPERRLISTQQYKTKGDERRTWSITV